MPANVETMMYTRLDKTSDRELPWHRSGTEIDAFATSAEALVAAGLDWRIELVPAFTRVVDTDSAASTLLEIPETFAVVRRKGHELKAFGTVGRLYTPFQNDEFLAFGDALVGAGARWDTAGALKGGSLVFAAMRLDAVDAEVRSGLSAHDPHTTWLLLSNSHDGSSAAKAAIVRVRVVCTNTHLAALSNAPHVFSIRHIGSLDRYVTEAQRALELSVSYASTYDEVAERLANVEFSLEEFTTMTEDLIPLPEKRGVEKAEAERASLLSTLKHSKSISDDLRFTRWGAFNAVTEWSEHVRDNRFRSDASKAEKKLLSVAFGGPIDQIRSKAWKRLSSLG